VADDVGGEFTGNDQQGVDPVLGGATRRESLPFPPFSRVGVQPIAGAGLSLVEYAVPANLSAPTDG
jgi:hypothetical protein